jgi:glycosyltransferase involved in cell wall biosynthesis
MDEMKVLLVNDYASDTGGAELHMRSLRSQLLARGHDARLFSSTALLRPGDESPDYSCVGTTSRFRTLLQTANPWAHSRLSDAIDEFKPDLVHVMMFLTQLSPLILPVLRRVPTILNVVWHRPVCPIGTKMLPDGSPCGSSWGMACYKNSCLPARDWAPLMLQMRMFRQWRDAIDMFVANSHATRCELARDGVDHVEVLYPGTAVVGARPPLGEAPRAGFVGRLVPEKGADVLIEAFARVVTDLPQAKLVIVGEGPERPRLERLIAASKLSRSVTLKGRLSRQAAEKAMEECWVQVAPSRWAEPFGLVAIEAQMRGTAVVASQSGGFCETVDDGRTGVLVPPGDVGALSQALLQLLAQRERAEEMGRAGRERALRLFTESISMDRLLGLYGKVLGDRMHAVA